MLFSFGWACSTAPDFNRNNTKDPKSEYYVPELPENSPVSIALDNNRNVRLSWEPKEMQDGVIISKKYYPNSPFAPLDTLYSLNYSYTDSSGHFIPGTTYKVDFFRLMSDSSMVLNRAPAEISMEFDPFDEIYLYYDRRLEISYNYSNRTPEGFFRYFDGVEVLINTSGNIDHPTWDTVGVVSHNQFEQTNAKTNLSFELFDLHIKVNQFIADSSDQRIPLSSTTKRFYINSIDDVRFEFINELNGTVRWSNSADFYAGYIIESNQKDTVYGGFKSSHHLQFTEPPTIPLTVSVTPFIGNNKGKKITASRGAYPEVYTPVINFNALDDHSFQIQWSVTTENQAAGYIIEHINSTNSDNNAYTSLDTVSADQRSYTLSNMDRSTVHKFRVRSYTSSPSNALTVGYQRTLMTTEAYQLSVNGSILTFSKTGTYSGKQIPEDDISFGYGSIYVKDQNSGLEYFHEIPSYPDEHRPYLKDFVISESQNTIIYLGDNHSIDNSGEFISVFDFINEEFIVEYHHMPEYGKYKLALLSDDSTVVIPKNDRILLYDSSQGNIIREVKTSIVGRWIMKPFQDTALLCSENGIYEYNLISGAISNQVNEKCNYANLSTDQNLLTFHDNNNVKVLDLNTFSILKTINDPRFENPVHLYNFWYFREDDMLIYLPLYLTYQSIYYGYLVDNDKSFSFTLPSYNEDRIYGYILRMERNPIGTYNVITLDGEFTLSFKEAWGILEVES